MATFLVRCGGISAATTCGQYGTAAEQPASVKQLDGFVTELALRIAVAVGAI